MIFIRISRTRERMMHDFFRRPILHSSHVVVILSSFSGMSRLARRDDVSSRGAHMGLVVTVALHSRARPSS